MGTAARGSREIYSSSWYVSYTTLVADKDLYTDGPGGLANSAPCRRIVPGGTGNIVLVRPDGVSVTVPVIAGQNLDVQAKTITAAGTTCTSAVVFW